MTHPDDLDLRDAAKLRAIRDRDADLDRLTRHVRAFAAMMTGRHGDRLHAWITAVESDTLPPLAAFAANLRRDLDAVRYGLTLPYSSGPSRAISTASRCSTARCSAAPAWTCSENAYSLPADHMISDRTRILTINASMNTTG
jgi:transposase